MLDTYSGIMPFMYGDFNTANPHSLSPLHTYAAIHNTQWPVQWNAVQSSIDLSFYIPFSRDWGTFGSASSWQTLSWWTTNHPDWILYQSDQSTPAYFADDGADFPQVRLDFSSSAVISWQVSQYGSPAAAFGGFNYLFADNLDISNFDHAVGAKRSGVWTPLYTGSDNDATYAANVAAWCSSMRSQLAALSPSLKLVGNLALGSGHAPTEAAVTAVTNNLDAVLIEGDFTNQGTSRLSGTAWVQRVQWMQSLQAASKGVYLVGILPVGFDITDLQWSISSYLMGKYHSAALYLTPRSNSGSFGYGTEHYYDQLTSLQTIGTPLEDMTLDGSVYRRKFTGGIVLANPDSSNTYTYSYNGRVYTFPPTTALTLTNFSHVRFQIHA